MVTSLSGAIHDAVGNLVRACLDVVADDESSPLRGRSPDGVTSTKGGIYVVDAPSIGETYVDILARHGTTGDNRGPTFRPRLKAVSYSGTPPSATKRFPNTCQGRCWLPSVGVGHGAASMLGVSSSLLE
jgi:hypothetical protein